MPENENGASVPNLRSEYKKAIAEALDAVDASMTGTEWPAPGTYREAIAAAMDAVDAAHPDPAPLARPAHCSGSHKYRDIFQSGVDGELSVVRWCTECGAVVVDVDRGGRTLPGKLRQLDIPANIMPKAGTK